MALLNGKQILDGSIPGTKLAPTATSWKDPVDVLQLVGNASPTTLNGLSPTAGDAYVVITAGGTLVDGSLAVSVGDLVEYSGTVWVKVVAQSGGFPPAGTRAVLATQTALTSPYTENTDDGKVVKFSGASLTATDTSEAVDGHVVVVNAATSYFANKGYIFDGATGATAVWSQFTGAGQITAGQGLTKTNDTLNVGDAGKGVQVNTNDIQIDASEIASSTGGLTQVAGVGNEHLLAVKPDVTTGANTQPVSVGTNGVGLDVNAIVGNGLQADGSANLDVKLDVTTGAGTSGLAVGANGLGVAAALGGNGLTMVQGSPMTIKLDTTTGAGTSGLAVGVNGLGVASALAGNGLSLTQGSAMTVDPDSETGANIQPVNVTANGVGLDVSAIAGNGLQADGSANLDVKPDVTTGANTQPVSVGANGVGLDVSAIAGNGLQADGSANLDIKLDTVTGGGVSGLAVGANGLGISTAAAGVGLSGGGGSALAIATASENVTFTTSQWTWPADTLFVTGTPTGATAAVNKTYVDNLITGNLWKNPVVGNLLGNVDVIGLVGNLAALAIEALTPAEGDAYVVSTANGAGDLSGAALGDIWQYVSATWVQVVAGSGGFVPAGVYALLSTTETLVGTFSGYTQGDLVHFDGTSLDSDVETSPAAGWGFVVDGSGATGEGSFYEWSGTAWVELVSGVGGFVPAGTRAITGLTPPYTLISPYTDATDDGKIVSFGGASNTGSDTGDAVDTASLLFQDPTHVGVYDNLGYVFEGTVPTGSWIQFTGAGQLNAGAGLDKTGNTLFIGDAGKGVQVNADDLEFSAAEAAATSGGLKAGANSWQLAVEPNDFAGVGLEDDGSDNLRVKLDVTTGAGTSGLAVGANGLGIAAALGGNGLTMVQGSPMTIKLDTTTGGGVPGLAVGVNGLGVAAALAGNGLSLTQGSAMTIDPDSETGGNIQPVNVTANGVGLDINAIAGNGLQADGSANLQVLANGDSISVGASGVKAAVPTSSDKAKVPAATSGDGQSSTLTITATPAGDGYVVVKVNGISYEVGNGVKTKDCFFSGDTGSTAKAISAIAATDVLYWNGVIAGFDLATTDRIDFDYNVIV